MLSWFWYFCVFTAQILAPAAAEPLADARKEASDAINSGQSSLAVDKLDIVLELDSSDTLSMFKRAVLCMSLGRYEKALRDLDSIILLKPNHTQALGQRAKINLLYCKIHEALQDATAAELKNQVVEIEEVKSKVEALDYSADKIAALSYLIQKCPLAPEYRLRRGNLYSESGQVEMAVSDYRYLFLSNF
jgi:tetratricopeptide (TPR) repeat protein